MDSKEVTKPKHPSRVASGKRLVEWNRRNKENLLKNKEQEPTSAPTSAQEPTSAPTSAPTSYTLYVAAAGLIAWILWTQKKKAPAVKSSPPPPPKPTIDLAMF